MEAWRSSLGRRRGFFQREDAPVLCGRDRQHRQPAATLQQRELTELVGVGLERLQRHRLGEAAHEGDIDQVPARFGGRRLGIVVFAAAVELGRIRIGGADDFGGALLDGRVVPLTMNFRSVAPLCTWANEVFKTRFPENPTAHAPRFAALDPKDTSTSGGVFTITNLGGIGGTSFTPIVNHPEVAILGVSRASTEPVWTQMASNVSTSAPGGGA